MDAFFNSVIQIIPREAWGIDRDLLLLAFLHRDNHDIVTYDERRLLLKKYGADTYENLEFLGDGVLEIIIKHMVYQSLTSLGDKGTRGPGAMTGVSQALRSNAFLACLAERHNLCSTNSQQKIALKLCADIFEALLGALFLYLIREGLDAYRILYVWLVDFWHFPMYLKAFLYLEKEVCFQNVKSTPPKVNLNNISLPLPRLPQRKMKTSDLSQSFLEKLTLDEVKTLLANLKVIEATKENQENPEEILASSFRRFNWGKPQYILQEGYGVLIPCPMQICPEGDILGISQNHDLGQARRDAARQANENLKLLGFF